MTARDSSFSLIRSDIRYPLPQNYLISQSPVTGPFDRGRLERVAHPV